MASKSSVRTSPGTEQKAKDLRWEAIEAVRAQDGILGLKHFHVQEKLGRRNFGIVHLCELKGTKCYFAMKCIAKASCAAPERLLRAQTEKEILQSVDHLFLPTLYAHIETEKYYRLVMEFCPGGDLHALQEKQPGKCFPEQAVKFYAAEVLLAMEYLHMLGIIYCDLNPQNALVRDDGHIMLSNFDLSLLCAVNPMLLKSPPLEIDVLKKSSVYCTQPTCIEPSRVQPSFVRLTEVGNKVSPLPELIAEPTSSRSMSYFGSHEYLAPEIIKDKGHTSAVDWWTFGIFLYELLFGKTPFKGSEYQETLANVVGQPLSFPESPAVSIQAKDLIRGLLVKEPQHRLAFQQGATEIKQHPFFEGVNWDLIRFASPPEIPSPTEFERLHRPLPATSSENAAMAVGSSQKGKTINQSHAKNLSSTTVHKFTDIMLSVESANNVKASSAAANKASNVSSNSNVLKPPPSVPAPGLTPLKPTPEKAEPFSPERPASSRRAPSIGGPPHPLPTHPEEAPPPPPPPPPPPRGRKSDPKALPPSKGGITPSRSSPSVAVKGGSSVNQKDDTKAKLKPLYWEKIRANVNHSMVWDRLEDGSFRYSEEMIESLFGYAPMENKDNKKESSSSLNTGSQFINFIDQRKTLNLLILLKSLNVTKEKVCDALLEGKGLPSMLLETLLKMAPTKEQESKLRLFDGEISQLGRAEQFLKALVDIPFAFKRLEILLFRDTFQEEANSVKEAFITLEAACKELRNSRLFLKLLEAVLKTGNRMNDGTRHGDAQAFKLDALLKMADIKGTDHKTTLLHFVVQEIIHSEGVRAVRADRSSTESEDHLKDVPDDSNEHHRSHGLQVVSGLGDQLNNVKKAACLDYNGVLKSLLKLGDALHSAKNFPNNEMTEVVRDNGIRQVLEGFVQHIEGDIMQLLEEEKRITGLLIKTARYFHINYAKEEGLRLFGIVRDFLIMLDKVCLELKKQDQMTNARQTFTETPFEN